MFTKGPTSTNEQQNEHKCEFSANAVAAKPQSGFTLIETLVAITIMLLVIVGPMTVAQKGIQNAYFATQQATAVFLAQEGVEAVREYRDNKALAVFDGGGEEDTGDWYSELGSSCEGEESHEGCIYTDEGLQDCSPGSDCDKLYFKEGQFSHTSDADSTESPFSRRIQINEVSPGVVSVDAVVSWETTVFGGYTEREARLQSWVYDHYARYEP